MSSECLVINEWILHDLRGENGRKAQKQSYEFLRRLKEKGDRMAVLRDSPWMEKAYGLMTLQDIRAILLSKYLHSEILRDSKSCWLLDKTEISAVPDNVKQVAPPSDIYLIETYYSTNATSLITTDEKLLKALSNIADLRVNVTLRDPFLKEYFS